MIRRCVIFMVILLVTPSYSLKAQAVISNALASIKPYYSPFSYSGSSPDFNALERQLTGTTIIAAGEATHGTKEFFETKRELFKYLVSRHGFRVIAIEANMADVVRANEFINGKTNDSIAALQSLSFWCWKTHEVLSQPSAMDAGV